MQPDSEQNMNLVIEDLNTLIVALENNPNLSSWVIRQVLKSIKGKAEKMAAIPVSQPNYSNPA